jgi:hypothetical protein
MKATPWLPIFTLFLAGFAVGAGILGVILSDPGWWVVVDFASALIGSAILGFLVFSFRASQIVSKAADIIRDRNHIEVGLNLTALTCSQCGSHSIAVGPKGAPPPPDPFVCDRCFAKRSAGEIYR